MPSDNKDGGDAWGAAMYKRVEQISGPATQDLVAWAGEVLSFEGTPDASVLDDGCGTGVLTRAVKERCKDVRLTAGDLSLGCVFADCAVCKGQREGEGSGTAVVSLSLLRLLTDCCRL